MTTSRRRAAAELKATREELASLKEEAAAARAAKRRLLRGLSEADDEEAARKSKKRAERRQNNTEKQLSGGQQLLSLISLVDVENFDDDANVSTSSASANTSSSGDSNCSSGDSSNSQTSTSSKNSGGGARRKRIRRSSSAKRRLLTGKSYADVVNKQRLITEKLKMKQQQEREAGLNTANLTQESFLQFIQAARLQANETMRRTTDAKLAAVAHLPRVDRAAAYVASKIAPDFNCELDDLDWEAALAATSAGLDLPRFLAPGGGSTTNNTARREFRRSISALTGVGAGGAALKEKMMLSQQQQHQQPPLSSSVVGTQNVLMGGANQQQQQQQQQQGDQTSLRQIKAAHNAAAIANEQQRKIVAWRNADEAELVKRAVGTLHDDAVKRQEARLQQTAQQSSSPLSAARSKEQQQQQHQQGTAGRAETTVVGFDSMAVDDTGFDAAVHALTAEAHTVQRAGLRERWYEQAAANRIEFNFRKRIAEAVAKGEMAQAQTVANSKALESLFPQALSDARSQVVRGDEERARWVVIAEEKLHFNTLRVEAEMCVD